MIEGDCNDGKAEPVAAGGHKCFQTILGVADDLVCTGGSRFFGCRRGTRLELRGHGRLWRLADRYAWRHKRDYRALSRICVDRLIDAVKE